MNDASLRAGLGPRCSVRMGVLLVFCLAQAQSLIFAGSSVSVAVASVVRVRGLTGGVGRDLRLVVVQRVLLRVQVRQVVVQCRVHRFVLQMPHLGPSTMPLPCGLGPKTPLALAGL